MFGYNFLGPFRVFLCRLIAIDEPGIFVIIHYIYCSVM